MERASKQGDGHMSEQKIDGGKAKRPTPPKPAPGDGYMETFDVLQGAHPERGVPLPEDDEE